MISPDAKAIVRAVESLTAAVQRVANSLATPQVEQVDAEDEAFEPEAFAAIDKLIREQGPTITVHDDEITIEGLRIEHPARLTVHAGRRRLNLRYNAFFGDPSKALDVCRDLLCHCHQTKES